MKLIVLKVKVMMIIKIKILINLYRARGIKEFNKDIAEVVGIGAIKFNDLKRECKKDIVFSWDEILNLKGDSGPYLQYSYARAKSILRKAKEEGVDHHTRILGIKIKSKIKEKMLKTFLKII